MKLHPVDSTLIARVGYDGSTLRIEFESGGAVDHFDVGADVYARFMAADSHGKFYNAHIKNAYRYRPVAHIAPGQDASVERPPIVKRKPLVVVAAREPPAPRSVDEAVHRFLAGWEN